jgi:prepilin-type N-terminal cleavage/methylation domain-containing protein
MKTGYTLIELMIVITITALLVAFGVSGYTKAQKNQNSKFATEAILTSLSEAQKRASSGTNDCSGGDPGEYLGQQVVLQNSTITTTPICRNSEGTEKAVTITGLEFTTTHTLTFKPLNQGVDLVGVTTENIDYTDGRDTYRVEVMRSGSIRAVGRVE